eukprot:1141653-Pelagomonas_calceolata.AAC.6
MVLVLLERRCGGALPTLQMHAADMDCVVFSVPRKGPQAKEIGCVHEGKVPSLATSGLTKAPQA